MTTSKELEPIEIHFGDVFNPSDEADHSTPMVVVDLQENCIISCAVNYSKEGEELLIPSGWGTDFRERIREITGHWNLARILLATERGFKEQFHGMDQSRWQYLWLKSKEEIIKDSQKPPIILVS